MGKGEVFGGAAFALGKAVEGGHTVTHQDIGQHTR